MRGLFVTATDTGVGKTILSAALLAAMAAAGERVRAVKPVLTGMDEPPEGSWGADHEVLGAAAGMDPESVAPARFGAAASPHLAAALEGTRIEPERLLAHARAGDPEEVVIVEGVGGLLVPLGEDYRVRDLAVDLGLALVIAARPGLGTINHTLLTLEAARARGLDVAAVVLTPWPDEPGALERSNRQTIEGEGAVEIAVLAHVPGPGALASAGATLPWRRWCAAVDFRREGG